MAGNATQIRAGQAYVELGARDDKLAAALKNAEKKLKAWGSAISSVGKSLMGIGGAAVAGLAGLAETFSGAAVDAGKLAARTGIALDQVQSLAGAVGGPEALEEAIGHMDKTLDGAIQGSAEAEEALARLGVTTQELASMAPDQQFKRLATAIAGVRNPAMQAHLAEQVFGRGILEMLPTLQKGAAGIEELQNRFAAHHQGFSKDDVESARRFQFAVSDLTGDLQRVGMAIGKAVLPLLEQLVNRIVPIVDRIVDWVGNNTDLVQTIAEVAAGVLAAGVALYALGEALSAAGAVLGVVLNPFVLLPALVIGGVGAVLYFTGAFDAAMDIVKEAWGGVVDAISAGDLELAGKIAVKGLEIAWLGFRNYFLNLWDDMRLIFANVINEIWRNWDQLVTQLKIAWLDFRMLIHVTGKEAGEQEKARLKEEQKANNVAADDRMDHAVKTVQGNKDARQGEVDDAKAQLTELSKTASKEAAAAKKPKEMTLPPPPPSTGMPGLTGKGESIGSFSAAAAGGLGLGSGITASMQTTAQATTQTAANTQIIAQLITAIGAVG